MARRNFLSHFYIKKLGLSADDVTTSSNGTCTVWKTPSVTFNLYIKTKTLLVQGKAVDSTRDLLLQTMQADKNQNSVEAPDERRFARRRFARTESRFARNKRRFARTESRFARFLF